MAVGSRDWVRMAVQGSCAEPNRKCNPDGAQVTSSGGSRLACRMALDGRLRRLPRHRTTAPRHVQPRPVGPHSDGMHSTSSVQSGVPVASRDSPVNETLTLITAELCANAVLHGRVSRAGLPCAAGRRGRGRTAARGSLRHPHRTVAVRPPPSPPRTPSPSPAEVSSSSPPWPTTGASPTAWAVPARQCGRPSSARFRRAGPAPPTGQGANGGTAARRGSDRPPSRSSCASRGGRRAAEVPRSTKHHAETAAGARVSRPGRRRKGLGGTRHERCADARCRHRRRH